MIRSRVSVLFFVLAAACTLNAAEPTSEKLPLGVMGRLSISKTGTFLDNTAAYANQLSANSGPIAKMAVANVLFKVPFDKSLNFDGPSVIYLFPPLTFVAEQDTASILSVSDAVAMKKNLASIYGEPEEKNGALMYVIPQPLPLPDKILFVKFSGDKALLASNEVVLASLDPKAAERIDNTRAAAELAMFVPALKEKYGKKAEASLQIGAALAAENMEGLKVVTDQLAALQKSIWEIEAITLRVEFDKDSKNLALELAIKPLSGTQMSKSLSTTPVGVNGKFSAQLPPNAPIHAAISLDTKGCLEWLKKVNPTNEKEHPGVRTLLEVMNGETAVAVFPEPFAIVAATADAGGAKAAKGPELYQHVLDILVAQGDDSKTTPNALFGVQSEKVENGGQEITLNKPKAKQPGVENLGGALSRSAQAPMKDGMLFSFGEDPVNLVKGSLEREKSNATQVPELKVIFAAPPPGTLVLTSLHVVELIRLAAKGILPPQLQAQQLVGGLDDSPVSVAVFVDGGKAGLRAGIPGATAGSLLRMYFRLKRANIDLMEVITGLVNENVPGGAGDSVAPPPPGK